MSLRSEDYLPKDASTAEAQSFSGLAIRQWDDLMDIIYDESARIIEDGHQTWPAIKKKEGGDKIQDSYRDRIIRACWEKGIPVKVSLIDWKLNRSLGQRNYDRNKWQQIMQKRAEAGSLPSSTRRACRPMYDPVRDTVV